MDSEAEIDRRYTDLTMIIRSDKRHFEIFDVLIEFKYISLKDAGMTGEKGCIVTRNRAVTDMVIERYSKKGYKMLRFDGTVTGYARYGEGEKKGEKVRVKYLSDGSLEYAEDGIPIYGFGLLAVIIGGLLNNKEKGANIS
jgi:hypothetical protein